MGKQNRIRILGCCVMVFAILAGGTTSAAALPPAPVPVSPAPGSMIVIPTFSWQPASEAEYYEVEVGPQSNPAIVYWSDMTYNLALTPNHAATFTNEPLYWRVRAYDSSNNPGSWSSKVNFTKYIPAPVLTSPASGNTIVEPVLEWQAVQGAAKYKVELSTSPTFITLDHTYTTYNTRITPAGAIAHSSPWYWRVSGVDAEDHVGTTSAPWNLIKNIPAPTLVSPTNGSSVVEPVLEWQAVEGAAYYKVELSAVPGFVPVDHTYTTYNTRITPAGAIAHGTVYWRVSGVDAEDHVGTASAGWSFTKNIPAPTLVSPANGGAIAEPILEWQAVEGAAYYKVELSLFSNFTPVAYSYTTYNTRITPDGAIALNTYYWRVSGVDAGDHVGAASTARTFTLNAWAGTTDPAPVLQTPADGETISADPNFSWTHVTGAADYHLIVSRDPAFGATYDGVYPDYVSYTPYIGTSGDRWAYPNDTYYWKVEARNGSGVVIATSLARSFTKQMALPLIAPADGAALTADPTFQWTRVVGAHDYHLIVSAYADFHATYDYVYPDYVSFTPYVGSAGQEWAYPNGTYYWKVEARDHGGTVIATSLGRSFTKQMTLPLIAPANGSFLTADPTFQWTQVVGARDYYLKVSKDAGFGTSYDYVYTDYPTFTPYDGSAGQRTTYGGGTYYWRVQARDHGGTVIVTSDSWIFIKGTRVYLPIVVKKYP
jgi:large repetitive protein